MAPTLARESELASVTNGGQQAVNGNEQIKEETWSTILQGVASTKIVPTKNVLILGDPHSGKSTLIHYIKHDPGPKPVSADSEQDEQQPTPLLNVATSQVTPMSVDNLDEDTKNELALGFTYVEVADDENEDTIARLALYQLGLSAPEYLPLLNFAINTNTIADSMIVLVLDWSKPWGFIEALQRWIKVLDGLIDNVCKEGKAQSEHDWSRGQALVDELKEKIEQYLQTYVEPFNINANGASSSTSSSSVPTASAPLVTTTTTADQVTLPLTQGSLTTNLGIPIAVVCCKSDLISQHEHTQDYKEEQFDFIQQTLRTICMKYGAALFYTSTLHPHTFHNLRQYILHRLLTVPTKPYPFSTRAMVVERDTVLVPAGWDSWGKIRVLREGFDCEGASSEWDDDIAEDGESEGGGTRKVYEEVIPDPEADEQPLNHQPAVTAEDEQVFLERHFETLQRTSESPSRPATSPTSPGGPGSPNGSGGPSQNEVLANFFQSLLSKKASSGGAASPTPSSTSPTASGRTSSDDTRRTPMSRKDVQKELDRMRGLAGK
ncbi:dynein light intermediate chain-domain-containing protein [Umbelopsis sp. PMI_123]|nr:dynein light intermediate chain-domain-containing protein [Umbelopsis sp. PMI_123]